MQPSGWNEFAAHEALVEKHVMREAGVAVGDVVKVQISPSEE